MPDGRIRVDKERMECSKELLLEQEQFVERMNFYNANNYIWAMMTGLRMVKERKVEHFLEQFCYSLFVMKQGKGMVLMLLGGSTPVNPIVWAMKTYPNSVNIQLYAIWMVINAMYWSQSGHPVVAD